MPEKPEVDDAVLEEGCYYLSELGLSLDQIASHFESTKAEVKHFVDAYAAKLKAGEVVADPFDRTFWDGVRKEAEGDVKVTVLSEKGFHHAWKSDLRRLDGPELMAVFEASKDFLNMDPNQRFLDYKPPMGYDPLAMEREVKKSVEIISALLDEKWKEENPKKAAGQKPET